MSRVDRLQPHHKRTLQTASVLGRTFQHGVLDGISDDDLKGPILKQTLEELVERDFFHIVSESGSGEAIHLHSAGDAADFLDTEYAFKNAMTAEVAYESLLKSQRRELHKRTGDLIETIAPDRLDELAAILAFHFRRAEEYEKSYRYMVRSASRAAGVFANKEAASCFSNALALVGDGGPLAGAGAGLDPAPASVHEALADVYYVTGRYPGAADQLDLALVTIGESPHRVTLLRKKGQVYEKWGKYNEAKAHFEAALDLMRKPLDTIEAGHIYSGLGLASYHEGNLDEAVELATLALEMMETVENDRGIAQAASNLGIVYFKKEDWPNARLFHERSVAISSRAEDVFGLAAGHNNLGLVALREGGWDTARAHFDKSLELFKKLGNKHGAARIYDNLSQVYSEIGEKDRAIDYMKKAVSILADISAEETGPSPEMWQSGAW
jgi:tetratricopeptide (TPR) repeat protein